MNSKPCSVFGIAAATILLAAWNMLAQENPAPSPDAKAQAPQATRASEAGSVAKITSLIGLDVWSSENVKLGKVTDLTVDLANGRIPLAILSCEDTCNSGELYLAVPPGLLRHDPSGKAMQLNVDPAKLAALPRFAAGDLPACCQTNEIARVYRELGTEPYFAPKYETNITHLQSTTNRPHIAMKNLQDRKVGDVDQIAVAMVYYVAEPCVVTNFQITAIPSSAISVSETMMAHQVLGMVVQNQPQEQLGYIENLMVDIPSGRLVAMIVSSGEFLGLTDELSPVPPGAFRKSSAAGTLNLNVSREDLQQAPHFNPAAWPAFDRSDYLEGLYDAYGLEPLARIGGAKGRRTLTGK